MGPRAIFQLATPWGGERDLARLAVALTLPVDGLRLLALAVTGGCRSCDLGGPAAAGLVGLGSLRSGALTWSAEAGAGLGCGRDKTLALAVVLALHGVLLDWLLCSDKNRDTSDDIAKKT